MRVLILEDDPSMGVLLEQLVRHLWPNAQVHLESNAPAALEQWKTGGADLALLDWELPGVSGIEVLKHIKRSKSKTLCVMVSGHADRDSILAAVAHHVDAFIVKPFDIDEVKIRLSQLMAAAHRTPPADTEETARNFASLEDFLAFNLTQGTPGLPIDPELVVKLKAIRDLDMERLRALLQRCQRDPALVPRVLSLANSHGYVRGRDPLETFDGALRRIGLDGLVNLAAELSLLPGSALTQDWLRAKFLELRNDCIALANRVAQLGANLEFEVDPARTACLFHRIGELSLLRTMQAWIDLGHPLDETTCAAILARDSDRAGDWILSQWNIPNSVRARVEATRFLPAGTVRKEQVIMRIAGLLYAGDPDRELPRLLARLGLPANALDALDRDRIDEAGSAPGDGQPPAP